MPAHQPGKSSTSFLRSRSATLTPEPLIIARLSSFWSGIHDDGKDVDIEVAPNHSTARQRLSLGEDCSKRPGPCFPFGGPKVAKLRAPFTLPKNRHSLR